MLLLKKKKYAAITTHEDKTGAITFQDEMKGLDLVRRDWCIQSKKSGRYILMDCIFSGEEKVSERAKRSERALMNTRIRATRCVFWTVPEQPPRTKRCAWPN